MQKQLRTVQKQQQRTVQKQLRQLWQWLLITVLAFFLAQFLVVFGVARVRLFYRDFSTTVLPLILCLVIGSILLFKWKTTEEGVQISGGE